MAKKPKYEKTLVLLDAHAILHRAFHALPDFAAPNGEPTGALYGVVSMLLKIIEELKPDYVVACYDLPEPTYRHHAFEGYKAKREKTDDALVAQIERSRDLLAAFGIPIYEHAGFEADDILGSIVAQTASEKNLRVIIASGDMDTMQLIDRDRVVVYTLKKGINDTILYDQAAVESRFGFGPELIADYKGLRGDPSDNIPGVPGIGEKGATQLITTFGSIEAIYRALKKGDSAFLTAGIKARTIALLREHEEEATFSKMLATIRTDAPITFSLPLQSWRDAVDSEAVMSLFSELGFRTLAARVRTVLALPTLVEPAPSPDASDAALVAKAALKLWLLDSDRTNPSGMDIIDYGRQQFGETDLTKIDAALMARLEKENLRTLYETVELPLQPVVAAMHARGIALNTTYLATLAGSMHEELATLEHAIYEQAGTTFNLNSPKQLGEVLFDTLGLKPKQQKKTATGQRSTKESELEKLRDAHPIVQNILRYRELSKLVSTYVDALPKVVGADGRVHSTFLQTGTTTGRMASQNPNLQNIPIKSAEGRAIRRAFVASPGYTLVAIDYSQVELRIAAILSGDTHLIDIFRRGEDVHTGVAVRVFGVQEDAVTPEMRRKAKVINFGILYGMGVTALRQNLGGDTSREEAQAFLNAYFNTFTRLAEYLEETKAVARKTGYTTTLFGRKRHFAAINSSAPFLRAAAERMAINAPIQGTAADIVRIAMVRADAYLREAKREDDACLLLQVHDELVFEVRTKRLPEVVPELKRIMESVLTDVTSVPVPLLTEVKVGENWEELRPWRG